ncbi:uncharacterized protein L3040_003781 [Drepanopeziza brunnea f. sp. 'multigermtubi']|uniref:2EXR domain-containing protein n=1 Tax=Marssonina brunnea f. sp. multigermtubi (strain MB_m1) TaxID=1072389 RepID=K1WCC3_MARBU|nr:uncharacterized protein MBM_06781 [Drepanopeziza brunnea f. sp. 'multigermtubi' MB_m1]EKD15020.1 hypothetical protein MBM_06781 [Drepanopeziza brunnea f. sp. 'multigermtubi' MB_m1]KAJ5046539.1 hypothetical protein L3040_003781 [Drepanopeziza brunnea f. sp. 'multigermtubi']
MAPLKSALSHQEMQDLVAPGLKKPLLDDLLPRPTRRSYPLSLSLTPPPETKEIEQPGFVYFGLLPPEVRLSIWRFCLPGPRLVPVRYRHETTTYTSRIHGPKCLSINRESRDEALRFYHELRIGPYRNVGCYVDLSIDTVYFRASLYGHKNNISYQTRMTIPATRGHFFHYHRAVNVEGTEVADDLVPIRMHSKIVIDDLLHSLDSPIILENLHTDQDTWFSIQGFYRCNRHLHPILISKLTLVSERKPYGRKTKPYLRDPVWPTKEERPMQDYFSPRTETENHETQFRLELPDLMWPSSDMRATSYPDDEVALDKHMARIKERIWDAHCKSNWLDWMANDKVAKRLFVKIEVKVMSESMDGMLGD